MIHHDYDTVLYPSAIYSQTHPDRLATLARLHGLKPHDVRNCRVLELGCGDGFNLAAMAMALPGSTFVGIDYAQAPIQKGRDIVSRLKLTNVELHPLDFSAVGGEFGTFDYIIAHGILSWIPEPVRQQMFALIQRSLAPHGIAYISYNALPGGHLRQAARSMMRQHVAHLTDPIEKINQGRALLRFLASATTDNRAYHAMLEQERDRVNGYVAAGFYHDDLGENNHAFYLTEFVSEAARHKLKFLSEAELTPAALGQYPPSAADALNQIPAEDFIRRRQYLDFVKGCCFHQSLLCHGNLELNRQDFANRLDSLLFAGDVRSKASDEQLSSNEVVEFTSSRNTQAASPHPWMKWALHYIGKRWPARCTYAEIESFIQAWQCSGQQTVGSEAEPELGASLRKSLLSAWASGLIEAHSAPSPYATEIPEHPEASPLIRWQINLGAPAVATLAHTTLKLEGDLPRELIRRMDGTRTRAQLAEELYAMNGSSGTPLPATLELFREDFEKNLKHLAGAGILMPANAGKI